MFFRAFILLSLSFCWDIAFANRPLQALSAVISPPKLSSNSYLLIDYNSGRILAEHNIDEQVEPASLTKMLTMYVVDSEIKNNKLSKNDLVLVSENANSTPGSKMFIKANSKVKVEDLIKGIIIQSGNDSSVAIAEHIAGSEASFADLMNGYANLLGLKNSHFVNATGLPDPNHYTTARDLATLSIALIRDFPGSYSLYAEKEFTYNNITQTNRNRLLWRNEKVDGIKTGHTESAGFCLVAAAIDRDMRLIAIVVGAKDDNTRTIEANKLLTWGFRFFETHKIYEAKTKIKSTAVWLGKEKTLDLGLEQDLYVTIPHGEYHKLKAELNVPEIIKAPIIKDQVIGNYKILLNQNVVAERSVIALNDVQPSGMLNRLMDNIKLTGKEWVQKLSNF